MLGGKNNKQAKLQNSIVKADKQHKPATMELTEVSWMWSSRLSKQVN